MVETNYTHDFDEKIHILSLCLREFFVVDGSLGYIFDFNVKDFDREIVIEYMSLSDNTKIVEINGFCSYMARIRPVKANLLDILYGI